MTRAEREAKAAYRRRTVCDDAAELAFVVFVGVPFVVLFWAPFWTLAPVRRKS